MNKDLILKIVGVVGIVGGCVCMYLAGAGESTVAAIVGAVFVLAALIAGVFGFKK